MNMATKHEVLKEHLTEWLQTKGDKAKRGTLTAELAKATKMHPKSIGRSMRTLQLRSNLKPHKRRGRTRYYDKAVDVGIYELWTEMECPCAETMHPMIDTYINSYLKHDQWSHGDEVAGKLRSISLGTLKNRVNNFRTKENSLRGYSTTKPSSVQLLVPIRKSHTWYGLAPGYTQTDTVVHCGDLLSGDVIYSLGIVDFNTYWSEYITQWNKGQEATKISIETLIKRFPFAIRELHPDTGNEFINNHLYRWTQANGISMTRSEPYKKNDNMCIEERNNSIARRHLGYVRLDQPSLVALTSEILKVACLIHNHFRPVRRMITKVRIGAKWHRTYEKVAKTPYLRVWESESISKSNKCRWQSIHDQLDPFGFASAACYTQRRTEQKITKITLNFGNTNYYLFEGISVTVCYCL
jgi:hypothetical protein